MAAAISSQNGDIDWRRDAAQVELCMEGAFAGLPRVCLLVRSTHMDTATAPTKILYRYKNDSSQRPAFRLSPPFFNPKTQGLKV
jgi:hypothetical protein